MADTETSDALLSLCLHDLASGEAILAPCLPQMAEAARMPDLGEAVAREAALASDHQETMAALAGQKGGPDNLWMRGICDDAMRDLRSIASGPLLDTAMIGAVRKAIAARNVSYDTAIALARTLGKDEIEATLRAIREAGAASDTRFATLLDRCVAAV